MTKLLNIYAKEVKLESKKFLVFTTIIKEKFYKVKFTMDCNEKPSEKGSYYIEVNYADCSIQKGQKYIDKKTGEEKVENDILWISKVVDIRKETDEERKEKNELKMKKVFE